MPRLLEKYQQRSRRIETWESTSRALDRAKRVSVLAPADCPPTGVPVLFLLHGFGGSRTMWLSRTRLVEHLDGLDLVVVLPESGRRWFINDDRGHRYEDYLVGELVPFVDEHFGVHPGPGARAIGGFSMGGAAALTQALRHPGVFSVVVSHAGAFEASRRVGDPYAELRAARDFSIPTVEAHERVWGPPGSLVRRRYDLYSLIDSAAGAGTLDPRLAVYCDVGADDYPRIVEMNRSMAQKLREAGIDATFHKRQGAHDLAYLDRALPHSLKFADEKLKRS